jgi:hypothetical protein
LLSILFCFSETGFQCVAQAGLELVILLTQPPVCEDYRCASPHLARIPFYQRPHLLKIPLILNSATLETRLITLDFWGTHIQTRPKPSSPLPGFGKSVLFVYTAMPIHLHVTRDCPH